MAIDADNVIERARRLLTEAAPEIEYAHGNLRVLIRVAIVKLVEIRSDLFEQWKATTPDIAIEQDEQLGYVADIKPAIEYVGIAPDDVYGSEIFLNYPQFPHIKTAQWVPSIDRLTMRGKQDRFFVLAHLNGTGIIFKFPDTAIPGDKFVPPPGAPTNPFPIPPPINISTTFKIRAKALPLIEDLPEWLEAELAMCLAIVAPKPPNANVAGLQFGANKIAV